MTQPVEPPPTSLVAGILSFLVPGLGQIAQGRFSKGLMFLVLLLGLFHAGEAMGGWKNVYLPPVEGAPQNQGKPGNVLSSVYQRLHYAGQFWIGVAAWPALWHFYEMPVPKDGILAKLENYQRTPPEDGETGVNRFLVDSDKTPDLGLIYTVIAGVLNILVIYDAYAGPAFPPPKKKDPSPEPEGAT
jgi:hypothetical protein